MLVSLTSLELFVALRLGIDCSLHFKTKGDVLRDLKACTLTEDAKQRGVPFIRLFAEKADDDETSDADRAQLRSSENKMVLNHITNFSTLHDRCFETTPQRFHGAETYAFFFALITVLAILALVVVMIYDWSRASNSQNGKMIDDPSFQFVLLCAFIVGLVAISIFYHGQSCSNTLSEFGPSMMLVLKTHLNSIGAQDFNLSNDPVTFLLDKLYTAYTNDATYASVKFRSSKVSITPTKFATFVASVLVPAVTRIAQAALKGE